MACNGKTGDEPRALPWAGMKQAVGLKTAGGPTLLRPHTATGTYGLMPSSKHDPGQAGQGSGTHSGCVLRSAFTRWSTPLPLPTTGYPLATLRVGLHFGRQGAQTPVSSFADTGENLCRRRTACARCDHVPDGFVVVEDGSTDATWKLRTELQTRRPELNG